MYTLNNQEAERCLLCKNPKCQAFCPINTPIPEVISLYKEGRLIEAGQMLFENNPLSLVCSLVCIHEEQCKGNCVLNKKGDPIAFHKIEEEVSKLYLENQHLTPSHKDKGRIAIIGGGPAGITIAFILARRAFGIPNH